jgi:CRP-like cAMP-binding protein
MHSRVDFPEERAMAKFFKYLTEDELKRLVQVADKNHYDPENEDFLIREGEQQTGLFIIRTGRVAVKVEHMAGFAIELAQHGAGEIFGEMSFIEDQPASASVVPTEPTDAIIIKHEHIEQLIAEDPQIYGRFYQSLAEILSRRLRETSEKVSSDTGNWSPT